IAAAARGAGRVPRGGSGGGAIGPDARRRRLIVVLETRDVAATVAPKLRLDPVDGRAVAIGSLAPVAEARESLDRGLVALQVEARDELGNGIGTRGVGLRGRDSRNGKSSEQDAERSAHESFPHDRFWNHDV